MINFSQFRSVTIVPKYLHMASIWCNLNSPRPAHGEIVRLRVKSHTIRHHTLDQNPARVSLEDNKLKRTSLNQAKGISGTKEQVFSTTVGTLPCPTTFVVISVYSLNILLSKIC